MDRVREFLESIDPDYRDEVRQILVERKITDGPVMRCITRNVDRYTMAVWDRGLADAVSKVRPYWAHGMHVTILGMLV